MPYSSNSELPQSVRDKYSDKCQRAFRHAFNSTHEDTGDEGRAMASGHAAAQRCEEANKSMDTIGLTDFRIFTGLLKTSRSPDGKMRLHGVASSTTKDLHGDTMMASAIDDMERAANNNLTIFLNHSYNVPEDVGGSVEKAQSVTRGVDHLGNPNIDLNLDVLVNESNPRAVATWEAIERGTKLGLSIGAQIPDGGAKRNKDGTYLIEHVDLLETSIVGIPANPRSWVEYAVKAIKAKGRDHTIPLGAPTLTLNENNYTITGTLESTNIVFSPESGEQISQEAEVELELAAKCPTCGRPKNDRGDCTDAFHGKSIEPEVVEEAPVTPEVTDAQVTIIQIDTSDGDGADSGTPSSSQEAPASNPGTEDGLLDETADGDDAALGDDVTRSVPAMTRTLTETLDLLRKTSLDLIEARKALVDAETARKAAEVEKNAARLERDHVLRATQDILNRVANSPLVRKAVVVDAQRDFRARFEGVYSEEFLKMLEKTKDD